MSLDPRADPEGAARPAPRAQPPTPLRAPSGRRPYTPPALEALGSWRALTLFQAGQELSVGS